MNDWETLKYHNDVLCRKINDVSYLMVRKKGLHIQYAIIDLSSYNQQEIVKITILTCGNQWKPLSTDDRLKMCAFAIFDNTKYKDDYFLRPGRDLDLDGIKANLDTYAQRFLQNPPEAQIKRFEYHVSHPAKAGNIGSKTVLEKEVL